MDLKPETSLIFPEYLLVKVEKAVPLPPWLPEDDWYRYIIRQGDANMEGYKTGSLESVTEYAEAVTADLNERVTNKKYWTTRGRGKSVQLGKKSS